MHQSERIQCIRYLNELHYKSVELVKGLIYGLSIISFIGMLCQVVYLFLICGTLKFYESFVGRTTGMSREESSLSEQCFLWKMGALGSDEFSALNQVLCNILSMKAGQRKPADYASPFLEVGSGHFCAWAAADQRGVLSGEQRERWGSLSHSQESWQRSIGWLGSSVESAFLISLVAYGEDSGSRHPDSLAWS